MSEMQSLQKLESLAQNLKEAHTVVEKEMLRQLYVAAGDLKVTDFRWERDEDYPADYGFIARPVSQRALQFEKILSEMAGRLLYFNDDELKLPFLDGYEGIHYTAYVYEDGLSIQAQTEDSNGLALIVDIDKVNAWNLESFGEMLYAARVAADEAEQELKDFTAHVEYLRKKLELLEQAVPAQKKPVQKKTKKKTKSVSIAEPSERAYNVEPPYSRDTSG